MKKIKIFLTALIFVLVATGFIIADVVIDARFEQRVLNGRDLVDNYRIAHNRIYSPVQIMPITYTEREIYSQLIQDLNAIGYGDENTLPNTTIYRFFDESELLNYQRLNFENREDYLANATLEDSQNFSSMWN